MIKIYPCHKLSSNLAPKHLSLSGSRFQFDDYQLSVSTGPDTIGLSIIDNQFAYVGVRSENDENDWTSRKYDYLNHCLVDEIPTEFEVMFNGRDERLCYIKNSNQFHEPKETILIDRAGDTIFSHDEYLGRIKLDTKDWVCLTKRHLWTCISKNEGTIKWQKKFKYHQLIHQFGEDVIVLLLSDSTSLLRTVNVQTGEIIREEALPYRLDKVAQQGETIIFKAYDGQNKSTLYYNLDRNTYQVVPRSNLTVINAACNMDYCYSFTDYNDLNRLVIDDPSPYERTYIRRFDIKSGEPAGELYIPSVKFMHRLPFIYTPSGYGAIAKSRTDWPYAHEYLVLWDEEDFLDPQPTVDEEKLFFETERVEVGGRVDHRVSVTQRCENFFQLHRQLAIGLYVTGAVNGVSLTVSDKSVDDQFSGKIICDVSNHDLTSKECWAISHLCEHIAHDLAFDFIRTPCDPAKKIEVKPLFAG